MLGLYDFGARHYDPFVARWLTQDLMRQFLSSYLYCANNPVSFIDPTGMWSSFSMADTSRNDFMVGTDMWGRDKFDSFSGLYIPYQDRPGGASVEGYGNSDYGTFATWYTISSGHNYLRENQGLKETYTFWTTIRRDGQEFTWYSNPWDRYIRERDSEMSDHERTMSNPIVRSIHRAQFRFLRGTVELTASSLQRLGTGLSTVGYAAIATGPAAETSVPLVLFGNMLQYTGLGIESLLNWKDGNMNKIKYDGVTNGVMYGFGYLGKFAPGPAGAIFNLTLTPFNELLNYGGRAITTPHTKK